MNKSNKQKVSVVDLAMAASDEAAKEVVRRARETKTPIIICKDGKIKRVSASRFRLSSRQGKTK